MVASRGSETHNSTRDGSAARSSQARAPAPLGCAGSLSFKDSRNSRNRSPTGEQLHVLSSAQPPAGVCLHASAAPGVKTLLCHALRASQRHPLRSSCSFGSTIVCLSAVVPCVCGILNNQRGRRAVGVAARGDRCVSWTCSACVICCRHLCLVNCRAGGSSQQLEHAAAHCFRHVLGYCCELKENLLQGWRKQCAKSSTVCASLRPSCCPR